MERLRKYLSWDKNKIRLASIVKKFIQYRFSILIIKNEKKIRSYGILKNNILFVKKDQDFKIT